MMIEVTFFIVWALGTPPISHLSIGGFDSGLWIDLSWLVLKYRIDTSETYLYHFTMIFLSAHRLASRLASRDASWVSVGFW